MSMVDPKGAAVASSAINQSKMNDIADKAVEKQAGPGAVSAIKNLRNEGKKADKDYDKDGKVESPKDEVWGSRLRAAKKAGKMEEGAVDAGAMHGSKSLTQDRDPRATSYDKTLPKTYPGAASSAPTAARLSNAKAAVTPIKEEGVTAPKEWAMKAKDRKSTRLNSSHT